MTAFTETARKYHEELDAAIARALEGLAARGRRATCARGCAWCCRLPVRATLPEAALVAEYLRASLTDAGLTATAARLSAWVAWNNDTLPELSAKGVSVQAAWHEHGPGCPFLKDGDCLIYPVRPMGCRVHYSTIEPGFCGPDRDKAPLFSDPGTVAEVVDAVRPVCLDYRARLEGMGIVFETVVRFLPEMVLGEVDKQGLGTKD
ncbi:MAG: YkgJ family cysteine cluster protein [Nitrospirae bacterium]|nr:YkgJ family cysteine cluster protein [Nitrospirota bacterium]